MRSVGSHAFQRIKQFSSRSKCSANSAKLGNRQQLTGNGNGEN
ncbi:hypothetical protein A2U01_0117342, partial [Trifolium medium]|nr:hypothetical protein [Trifolium medium]